MAERHALPGALTDSVLKGKVGKKLSEPILMATIIEHHWIIPVTLFVEPGQHVWAIRIRERAHDELILVDNQTLLTDFQLATEQEVQERGVVAYQYITTDHPTTLKLLFREDTTIRRFNESEWVTRVFAGWEAEKFHAVSPQWQKWLTKPTREVYYGPDPSQYHVPRTADEHVYGTMTWHENGKELRLTACVDTDKLWGQFTLWRAKETVQYVPPFREILTRFVVVDDKTHQKISHSMVVVENEP